MPWSEKWTFFSIFSCKNRELKNLVSKIFSGPGVKKRGWAIVLCIKKWSRDPMMLIMINGFECWKKTFERKKKPFFHRLLKTSVLIFPNSVELVMRPTLVVPWRLFFLGRGVPIQNFIHFFPKKAIGKIQKDWIVRRLKNFSNQRIKLIFKFKITRPKIKFQFWPQDLQDQFLPQDFKGPKSALKMNECKWIFKIRYTSLTYKLNT